jgi:hypothetical protein
MGYVKSVRRFAPLLLPVMVLMVYATRAASQGSITPAASPTQESGLQSTFTDPFVYCAAVGTVDAPDSRYTGPKVPEAVARGLKRAIGVPANAPLESFLRNTFWRCMDGRVYACTVGANFPCQERADTSRMPGQGVVDFCKNNPQAEVIPAVVTGRTTVYEWKCTKATPEVVRQFAHPDARGFLSNIWYAINPNL